MSVFDPLHPITQQQTVHKPTEAIRMLIVVFVSVCRCHHQPTNSGIDRNYFVLCPLLPPIDCFVRSPTIHSSPPPPPPSPMPMLSSFGVFSCRCRSGDGTMGIDGGSVHQFDGCVGSWINSCHFSLVDGRISRRRGIADDGRRLRRQGMGVGCVIGRCGGG